MFYMLQINCLANFTWFSHRIHEVVCKIYEDFICLFCLIYLLTKICDKILTHEDVAKQTDAV